MQTYRCPRSAGLVLLTHDQRQKIGLYISAQLGADSGPGCLTEPSICLSQAFSRLPTFDMRIYEASKKMIRGGISWCSSLNVKRDIFTYDMSI